MIGPTDEELVLAVSRGRTESLGLLVSRWEQPLFRFVYRLIGGGEEARDVCQETFLRVLKNAAEFREGARFSTWMYQIALNLCRDRVRRSKRWSLRVVPGRRSPTAEGPAAEPASAEASPEESADSRRREKAVREAILALSPEQREVVLLKEYEGLKFREIAEVLGCPESTVKSRMYLALDAMRRSLDRRGVSP